MKKTMLMIIAALTGAALHADYQYLYWMVDETQDTDQYQFTYATVRAGDSSYLNLYDQSGDTGDYKFYISNLATANTGLSTSAGYAGLGEGVDYDDATFFFELWNQYDEKVGWKSVGYSALSGNIFANTQSGSGSSPYVVSNVIPEPTSGMLLLIGIAGLALRRRKQLNVEG